MTRKITSERNVSTRRKQQKQEKNSRGTSTIVRQFMTSCSDRLSRLRIANDKTMHSSNQNRRTNQTGM